MLASALKGVEGNRVAGDCTKVAAESAGDVTDRRYLREASLAHLTRKMTEARIQSMRLDRKPREEQPALPAPGGR